MGVMISSAGRGEFRAERVHAQLLRFTATGFIDRGALLRAYADAQRLVAEMDEAIDCFCDVLKMDSFEPGLPIRGLRWAEESASRIRTIAIATQSPRVRAVVQTFRFIVPSVHFALVTDLDGARRFFQLSATAPRAAKSPIARDAIHVD